jgi:hypothetical protein
VEALITGPGDGGSDLCVTCGGLTLEALMLEGLEPEGEAEFEPESYDWADMAKARCRRCGQATLSALIAQGFAK